MEFTDFHGAATALLNGVSQTLRTELTSIWLPLQIGLIVLAAIIARGIVAAINGRADFVALTADWPPVLRMLARELAVHLWLIAFILVLSIMRASIHAELENSRSYLLAVAVSLSTAWLVINVLTSVIANQFVKRIVTIAIWTIAALSILRLLDPVEAALDGPAVSLTLGGLRISPLLIIKTTALLLLTLWLANTVANFIDRRVQGFADLTPAIQVLISKLIRVALITIAVVIALNSMGIDLSVLAVFGGAIGVGVGFGLQKIVSNLVSGIILLADKSIKPGDVITVGEHFGWVTTMGARYTSVSSRDGREYLVPNEDFITQKVVNWSYSNEEIQVEVKFGVSYDSDPHRVREIAVAAATDVPRVLSEPTPFCHLVAFGDSSLDFSLRFWIRDPANGMTNVRGAVLLNIWDAFKREGIEIPFPVRDVRLTPTQSKRAARTPAARPKRRTRPSSRN